MWEELTDEQSGEVPEARSVFGATRMSENEIFLFGGAAAENASCLLRCRFIFFKTRSIYQDRLGTHIGKEHSKKRSVRFLQGKLRRAQRVTRCGKRHLF
jgi:hypothetical protein